MRRLLRPFCITLLLVVALAFVAYAQTDTTRTLPAVVVTEARQSAFGVGQRLQVPDSLHRQQYRHATAADWLAEQTGVFVKTYGLGALATPSFRGTGAAHTGIVWNGIVLNNAMNGTFDLSLLPLNLMDDVRLQFGGGTALMGSGLVGGSLLLDTRPRFDGKTTWEAVATGGSFGRAAASVKIETGGTRFAGSTRLYTQQAENNFPFANTALSGAPTVQQANAGVKQFGLMQTLGLRWQDKHTLTASVWVQGTDRQIPGNMTDANPGKAFQHDASVRATSQYQYAGRGAVLQTRAAFTDEFLRYTPNPTLPGGSDSRLRSYQTEGEVRLPVWRHITLNTGVHLSHFIASSSGYAGGATQTRAAMFSAFRYAGRRLQADISARQEWNDGRRLPLVPAVGARYQALNWLALRGHAAGVYRVPTLNERFWQPGGNPNLLPEQGWSHDAGLELSTNVKHIAVQAQVTYFGADVTNWVLWLPTADSLRGGFWAPQNLQQVQSRGLEFDVKAQFNLGRVLVMVLGGYTYTQSRIAQSTNAREVGKQLAYVPMHAARATLRMTYKQTVISYDQQLVGFRYISTQNDDTPGGFVPGYTVAGLRLSHALRFNRYVLEAAAGVNNLYDQAYQGIIYYPMPGRHYSCSISFSKP
jgi:iron complex outermembrane receptor protein